MFKHLFLYQAKSILRTKEALFWSLLFPILLGALFYFCLGNIMSDESFEVIPVAVVLDTSEGAADFKDVMNTLSDSSNDDQLFKVTYADSEKAKKLMKDDKVSGIITYENELSYQAAQSKSYDSTVTKTFLDQYQQKVAAIKTVMINTQGQADVHQVLETLSAESILKEHNLTSAKPDLLFNYFYTLLAMACFFASSCGVNIIQNLQANISPIGARQNCAPAGKLMQFAAKGLASLLVQFLCQGITLAYLIFVLKISFGPHILLVILTTFVGVLCGLLVGTTVSVLIKGSEMTKDGVASGIVMLGCFLSGMMSSDIKYLISTKAPVLAKINPVNLLTDAYYALFYYDDYSRYIENIVGLSIISVLLLVVTIFFVRRLNYDTI